MKLKVLFSLFVIAFLFAMNTSVRGEKNKAHKQDKECIEEEYDNFDFLYDGTEEYNLDSLQRLNSIMDEAFAHLGTRYRYGSKGPKTFDCSGFTSYVFGQYDMNIGCSSRDQYARNTPVKRSDMQPGDLVFFSSPRSGKGVGHVGIVVEVDSVGKGFSFIHASTNNGVTVNHSTDGYYSRRFIGVRRAF